MNPQVAKLFQIIGELYVERILGEEKIESQEEELKHLRSTLIDSSEHSTKVTASP